MADSYHPEPPAPLSLAELGMIEAAVARYPAASLDDAGRQALILAHVQELARYARWAVRQHGAADVAATLLKTATDMEAPLLRASANEFQPVVITLAQARYLCRLLRSAAALLRTDHREA